MHPAPRQKHTPKPPDGGWGWVVVFASLMVHVIADGVAYTFGLFFVKIADEFGNRAQTSMIASIMGGITYCIGPIAGALVNKYGCRPVSIAGSIIGTIGFAISYFANSNLYLFLSIGVLGGIGLGLIYLPAIVSVTCYFEKKRAFATGIAVCGSGLGTFLLAPLMEFLIDKLEWRGALLATSALILNCVIFSALFRPVPDDEEEDEDEEQSVPTIVEPRSDEVDLLYQRKSLPSAIDSEEPLLSSERSESAQPDVVKDVNSVKESQSQSPQPRMISFLNTNSNKDTLTMSVSHPVLPVGLVGSTDSLQKYVRGKHKRHSLKFGSDVIYEGPRSRYSTRADLKCSTSAGLGLISSRKDIFYSGSIANIPEMQGETNEEAISQKLARSPEDSADLVFSKRICGISCSPEVHQVFKTMMDVSILKNPVFLIFAFSNFLTSIGYSCPYIFLKDKAVERGIDGTSASWLIGIIGISNTLSRILLGYLSDKPCVNRLYLYNISLMLCGLATGLVGHTDELNWLRGYAVTFGTTVGVFVSLTSVILVDLLGLDKLTNAFGFLLLFQGIATLIGPPMIGALRDQYQDYRYGFWLAGGMITVSGLILFLIPCLQRRYPIERSGSDKAVENSQNELGTNKSRNIIYDQLNGDGLKISSKIRSNNNLATV